MARTKARPPKPSVATHTTVPEAFFAPLDPGRLNKRDMLIRFAARSFHRQGVNGTGIAEVMQLAGVGKGQFYHYFASKEQFVCEVVGFLMDHFLTRIAPFTYALESMDDYEAWFQPYLDFAELPDHLGCPVGSIASELGPSTPAVQAVVGAGLKRWIEALAAGLSVLQRNTGAGFDPLELAEELATSIQGALLMSRALQTPRYIYQVRDRFRNRLVAAHVVQPLPLGS